MDSNNNEKAKPQPEPDQKIVITQSPGYWRSATGENHGLASRPGDVWYVPTQPEQSARDRVESAREVIRQMVALANVNDTIRQMLIAVGNHLNDAATLIANDEASKRPEQSGDAIERAHEIVAKFMMEWAGRDVSRLEDAIAAALAEKDARIADCQNLIDRATKMHDDLQARLAATEQNERVAVKSRQNIASDAARRLIKLQDQLARETDRANACAEMERQASDYAAILKAQLAEKSAECERVNRFRERLSIKLRQQSDLNAELRSSVFHLRERVETAERDFKDDICYYCNKRTTSHAGNPDEWSLWFCHADEPGKSKAHHVGCVTERLKRVETAEKERDIITVELNETQTKLAKAREALELAAMVFRAYERSHSLKGTETGHRKARANAEHAKTMETALEETK